MGDFFSRQPFVLLSAIGLISLVSDFVALADDLEVFIDAWKSVTRGCWEVLLGWTGLRLPWVVQDYLTMSFTFLASMLRAHVAELRFLKDRASVLSWFSNSVLIALVLYATFWPGAILYLGLSVCYDLFHENGEFEESNAKFLAVFFESFVWAAIIIAANYAILFAQ